VVIIRKDNFMTGISNPILFDFPDHFETERLLIRAPKAGDGVPIHAAIQESLESLQPWMPWATADETVEELETFLRTMAARFTLREDLPLMLWRKSDGLYVGGSGLHRMDWRVPRFEIGYWVRTSLEGQGYITEAVNGITQFAFEVLGAERIEIRCDALNERSAAVARRTGYTLEGKLRRDSLNTQGQLRDSLIFSKIRGE
jgi:RimJ/RimL family protein N-acetyltransferase